MRTEDDNFLVTESQRNRYPILWISYENALQDMQRDLDTPKNNIIAIKTRVKKDREALYWHLSGFSSYIDEHFVGKDDQSLNSGAFVTGLYLLRTIERDAKESKLPTPEEINSQDIALHKGNIVGLDFQERWDRVSKSEQYLEDHLTRLLKFLGKPDCLESRMGAVDIYEIFHEKYT